VDREAMQPAVKQRLDRCKIKTLNNLLTSYNIVYPAPEPFHFHCLDKNGHKFVRIEIEDFSEAVREQLSEMRKELPAQTFIQVHFFEKHAQKPKLINI